MVWGGGGRQAASESYGSKCEHKSPAGGCGAVDQAAVLEGAIRSFDLVERRWGAVLWGAEWGPVLPGRGRGRSSKGRTR
ncbi:hypothetical protein Pcinc_019820 [Petrolisthes cinctipes]|uniref:Uncharacterized protein n=1 Tax=Petrolisthes cinctipes TaxID=88211 RepID=A0AAE1KKM3_PETCI|nr:hypothetical protein Pcinc_019820 [Petrolisthes cinctipes]